MKPFPQSYWFTQKKRRALYPSSLQAWDLETGDRKFWTASSIVTFCSPEPDRPDAGQCKILNGQPNHFYAALALGKKMMCLRPWVKIDVVLATIPRIVCKNVSDLVLS
jgi:hypothetical protein